MEEYTGVLQTVLEQTGTEISTAIAWFYLNFLSQPSDQSVAARVNTIVYRKERGLLSPPPGSREEQVLSKGHVTKKDLLAAQLYDIVETYANRLRMRDGPAATRQALDRQIDLFVEETTQDLSNDLQLYFRRGVSAQEMARQLQLAFETQAQRLNTEVLRRYEQAGWYQMLEELSSSPDDTFTYLANPSQSTCSQCSRLHEQTFTLHELEEQDVLPPRHPHCRCQVVPSWYAAILEAQKQALAQARQEASEEAHWYDALLRIPEDAKAMWDSFVRSQQERLSSGTLGGILDWLTLGIVSGFWDGLQERTNRMLEDPSLYTVGDWLTLGLVGLGDRALHPDEPLSLDHWLSSLGFASALYGMYDTVNKSVQLRVEATRSAPSYRAVTLEDVFEDGVVTVDDLRANPRVFSGQSVDDIAAALEKSGYETNIVKSEHSRSGAVVIKIRNPGGGKNITQVQVSPGGGRHGVQPYVKISTNDQGIIKIVDGVPSAYRTDGRETATILFSGGNES